MSRPPDPDGKNEQRAGWAEDGLLAFQASVGTADEDVVCDFLADLGHYCDRKGIDLGFQVGRAKTHYEAETGDKGTQFSSLPDDNGEPR